MIWHETAEDTNSADWANLGVWPLMRKVRNVSFLIPR